MRTTHHTAASFSLIMALATASHAAIDPAPILWDPPTVDDLVASTSPADAAAVADDATAASVATPFAALASPAFSELSAVELDIDVAGISDLHSVAFADLLSVASDGSAAIVPQASGSGSSGTSVTAITAESNAPETVLTSTTTQPNLTPSPGAVLTEAFVPEPASFAALTLPAALVLLGRGQRR